MQPGSSMAQGARLRRDRKQIEPLRQFALKKPDHPGITDGGFLEGIAHGADRLEPLRFAHGWLGGIFRGALYSIRTFLVKS